MICYYGSKALRPLSDSLLNLILYFKDKNTYMLYMGIRQTYVVVKYTRF